MRAVALTDKFAQFNDHWAPRIIAELNGQHVKVAKLLGEFVWHAHEDADEMFLVVRGQLQIHFRDHVAHLKEGEMIVVPRGAEQKPGAPEEVHVLLFEPVGVVNTGNAPAESKTVTALQTI